MRADIDEDRREEHAARLRSLHVPGDPLVLPNAWDAVSAMLVVDAESQATRLAAMRAAAGDALVINARVDTFARRVPNARAEAIERGRRYLDAGADPILALDEADIAAMVGALGVVNVILHTGGPSLARCRELGVARVSVGSGLHRVMTSQVGAVLTSLRDGDDTPFLEG